MIKRITLAIGLLLFVGLLKAQTIDISNDGGKISCVIYSGASRLDLWNAKANLEALGIHADIHARRSKKQITRLRLIVNSSEGIVVYQTRDADIIEKGVRIFVDRAANAVVGISVGPYREQQNQ